MINRIRQISLIFLVLVLTACGTANQLSNSPSASALPNSDSENIDSEIAHDSSDELEIKLDIDPESLQIKEICTDPDHCAFRQRCGRTKTILENNSNGDIEIIRIIFQKLDSQQNVVGYKELTIHPEERHKVLAHTEAQFYSKQNCECKSEDRHCTPEYPHLSSPFLIGLSEKIIVYYRINEGAEQEISAIASYAIVR